MSLTPVLPGSIVRSGGVGYRPTLPGGLMLFPGQVRPIMVGLVGSGGSSDPLAGIPLDLAFLTRRYPDSGELYGCYSNTGATVPAVIDGAVVVLRDDARSLEEAIQTTEANCLIARLVDGVPMLEFVGATPTTLVSSSFNTAGKAVIFVIKRGGGNQRFVGDGNGLINLAGGNYQLIGSSGSLDSANFTEFELECVRFQRGAGGNSIFHNGNILAPNDSDTLGTANAPLKNIGGFGGSFYTGYFGALVICDEAHGEAADLAVRQIFGLNVRTNIQVVALGDSLTLGVGATGPAWSYPGLLAVTRPTFDVTNMGLGGDTVANMLATSLNRVNRAKYGPERERNFVVVWGGTNDLVSGATGAATYANLVSLCNLLSAYGYEVIVGNTIVRNASAPFETERLAYNALIDANYLTFASARADFAGRSEFSSFSNLTYFNPDGIHLTNAGYAVAEDVVNDVITAVL